MSINSHARRRELIDGNLAEYLASHDAHFSKCDGFELRRACDYFDETDRHAVMRDLEKNEHRRSSSFRHRPLSLASKAVQASSYREHFTDQGKLAVKGV